MPWKPSSKSKELIASDDSLSDLDEIVKAIEASTMETKEKDSKPIQPAKRYNHICKLSSSSSSDELDLTVPSAGPKVKPMQYVMRKYEHSRRPWYPDEISNEERRDLVYIMHLLEEKEKNGSPVREMVPSPEKS